MTIRQKAVAGILCLSVLTSGVFYAAATVLVQNQFEKLEVRETKEHTSLAVDALNYLADNISLKLTDWASWDDTYQFIVDKNKKFVDSNLQDESVANLGLNFMLFFDRNDRLVVAKAVDEDGAGFMVPADIITSFDRFGIYTKDESGEKKGFLNIDGKPVLFAARPILNSVSEGPVRGTLIFAKYFTGEDQQKLANLTHLDVRYTPVQDRQAEFKKIYPGLNAATSAVKYQDGDTIIGYQFVNDYSGRPLFVTEVTDQRQAFIEAKKSVAIFLGVIAAVTLVSIIVAIRISKLVQQRDQTIKLKDEFFSIASHELRTPLGAIRGNALLLRDMYGDKNDQAFKEIVSDMTEASSRLIRLVNNFLDAARFEAGQVPISPDVVSLKSVADIAAGELQSVARDKNIYIRSEIDDSIPQVYADKDRVLQVIYNFVGNAAKFTERGGITISAAEQDDDTVKVCITDTGRGIPEDARRLLFQKFSQVKSSDSKSGSGLGMYISQKIVEKMGGRCQLEHSEEDKGTTISFTLPKATAIQIAASKK